MTLAIALLTACFADVAIQGLRRTHENVVAREFSADADTDSASFQEGLRRLRNMGLFATVDGSWKPGEASVTLSEKWTTIPIAKFRSGGGVSSFTVGAFDPNVLGRYLELGAQYENLGGTHSGVAWFREPRLAGTRTLLGGDVWLTNRLREDFSGDHSRGWHGERRLRIHAFVEPEIARWITPHLGAEYLGDTLAPDLIDLATDQTPTRRPGLSSRAFVAIAGLRLGRVDQDLELSEGWKIEPRFETSLWGEDFHRESVEAQAFWLPWPRWNLAARAFWGTGSQRIEFHDWRIGGLEQVRGLPENFLVGDQAWYTNAEIRARIYRGSWVHLQTVGFTDAGGIPGVDRRTSYGAGLRILSPKLYRLTLRLDWAQGFQEGLSGGLQQYF